MKRLLRVIISLVLLLLALLVVVLLVWPAYQDFSQLRAQIREQKERVQQGQEALVQLREIQSHIRTRQEEFDKIDVALPSDSALPILYEHIQQVAVNAGVSLTSLDGQAAVGPQSDIAALTFQVGLVGSYEDVKRFLEKAKSSARILNVHTLDISANSADPEQMSIRVELSAYAIAQPE